MDIPITPPLSKRRRLAYPASTETLPIPTAGADRAERETQEQEAVRIFAWNVNGIRPFLQQPITSFFKKPARSDADNGPAAPTSLRGFLKRHGWPHLLNLQEVKISPDDAATQRSVEQAVNRDPSTPEDGPSYTVRFCLPRDKYNAQGFGRKVYGVASVIRDDFLEKEVGRVYEVGWDLEGRVLCIELQHVPLSIFNVYAVNGTYNPYKDPVTGHVCGTRHDRKLAFHRLLVDECRALQAQGRRVVITGDLNVARERIDGQPGLREHPQQHVVNRKDFNGRFFADRHGLGAVDTFRHLHPDLRKYSWVSRSADWLASCDRVDYILVSRRLAHEDDALLEADVLMTQLDRGHSDHCPVTCTLDIGRLRGRDEKS